MLTAPFSILRRIRPQFRTGWIGIDIGSHSLKVAQLEIVDGQKRIAEAAVVPIPEGCRLTADSLRTGWLTRLLRGDILRRGRFRGRATACGLSMNVTDFRLMTIPPGSEKQRREMIRLELGDTSGSRGEAVEFDYWDEHARPAGSEGEPSVNILSVADGLASQVAESLHEANLSCKVLDGGPFMLARSVQLMNRDTSSDQPVAVLDWGHRATHFAVVINGQPAFSRVLKDCAVGPLVDGICHGLNISRDDCYELLSTYGVANPNLDHSGQIELQDLVADFGAQTLSQLIAELQKTLLFLRSHKPELAPVELWVLGGGSTIRNIEAKLSFEIGVPASRWRLQHRTTACTNLPKRSIELLAQAAALSELGWET